MQRTPANAAVLVTGAGGQIGSRLSSRLRASGHQVVAIDIHADLHETIDVCDITRNDQIARLFDSGSIRTVVHLAAILPTAFRVDPILGAEVNLIGTLGLLREAVGHGVKRFVFGSSMSVYGSSHPSRALNEEDVTAPDEPYGAAKRAVELVGENLAIAKSFGFVALRIARVVGPGVKSAASSWRSRILETSGSPGQPSLSIPFAPTAPLSLVHVDEVARMLMLLVEAVELRRPIYNSPVEVWETQQLAQLIERVRKVPVRTGGADGGPISDGTLFTQDFDFQLRGLRAFLSTIGRSEALGADGRRSHGRCG